MAYAKAIAEKKFGKQRLKFNCHILENESIIFAELNFMISFAKYLKISTKINTAKNNTGKKLFPNPGDWGKDMEKS